MQTTLRLSPSIIPLSLVPGVTITETITLTNKSLVPIPIQAAAESLLPPRDQIDNNMTDTDLSDWITITPTDTILSPGTGAIYTVTVAIPETIPIGGYGAMITFTPLVRQDRQANPSVIVPKMATLILSNIGVPEKLPPEKSARIDQFSLTPSLNGSAPIALSLRLTNTSLHYFTAKPLLKLTPVISLIAPIQPAIIEKTVFPGKTRFWNEEITIPFGVYRADLTVSLGEGQNLTASRLLIELPFTVIGAILAFLFGIILISKNVKKITKSMRAFLKG